MPPRKKPAANTRQTAIVQSLHPLFKKPNEMIGKTFKVPGSHWGSACANADKNKIYVCAIKDFSIAHKTAPDAIPCQAYLLSELGEDGHGGNSVDFWMSYPEPLLKHWYDTYPHELQQAINPPSVAGAAGALAGPTTDRGNEEESQHDEEGKKRRTMVLNYLKENAAERITAGKQRGRVRHRYECTIVENGKPCCSPVTIYGCSTGPFFLHVRRMAARPGNPAHAEVLERLNHSSCRHVKMECGEWVTVYSFEESFPHHVQFVWLVAGGLPMRLNRRRAFIDYVRGHQPRAVLPQNETVHRIVECIDELQQEELHLRLQKLFKEMNYLPCVGGQLDLWTDRNTSICYAAFHITSTNVTEDALELNDDLLDFSSFPFTQHTAANIKTWLEALLKRKHIRLTAFSGITADGAADGRAAIKLIDHLKHVFDVCGLHQLQRSLLYSIGMAGSKYNCRNSEARDLIRQHKRVVQLSHQSRDVSDGFRKAQIEAKIPAHKVLSTVRTNATRWGNQKAQLTRNILMRPIQDAVLSKYKREHVGETVLLEPDEFEDDDSDSDVPRTAFAPRMTNVTRREVGLTSEMWDASLELEAFMERPFQIKEIVAEKCSHLTGAQMLFLMLSLKAVSNPSKDLLILNHPQSISVAARNRKEARICADSVHPMITKARVEMRKQLTERFFTDVPSEARLVQLFMSKQADADRSSFPSEWVEKGKAFYLVWLRKAAEALKLVTRSSPTRVAAKKKSRNTGFLFEGLEVQDDDIMMQSDSPACATNDEANDVVMHEARQWANIPLKRISPFRDPNTGLLDEFKLIFSLRIEFPLHFFVFRQTCVHIGHEANAEDTFSLSGSLSNENTHTGLDFLSRLTRIERNKAQFQPRAAQVLQKYLDKYSKPELGEDVEDVPPSEDELDEAEEQNNDVDEESEGVEAVLLGA